MNAFIALSGKRVAVGYYPEGGVDVISTESGQRKTLIPNDVIFSLARLSDGTLVVFDGNSRVRFFNLDTGKELRPAAPFKTRKTNQACSLFADHHDNIYVGYTEYKAVDVFHKSGGAPFKSTTTRIQPWNIAVLRTGHLVINEVSKGVVDAVHVIDFRGETLGLIPGMPDVSPRMACDEDDNIYVGMRNERLDIVTVKKYSSQCKLIETVVKDMETTDHPRKWTQLTCFSSSEIAVCDVASMYIFCKKK